VRGGYVPIAQVSGNSLELHRAQGAGAKLELDAMHVPARLVSWPGLWGSFPMGSALLLERLVVDAGV